MADEDELLTVDQVAKQLQVTTKQVYKLIQDGRLVATNIGGEGRGTYRISRADLNNFLQSRRTKRD
jgi:excisionase family DNA binding protein